MGSESEPLSGMHQISATEASRSFSRLLDEIEQGHRFLVRRRGEDICVMAAPPTTGRRASECLRLLRGRPPVVLDGDFGDDLLEILAGEPLEHRQPWDC